MPKLPFDILVITDRAACAQAGRSVEATLALMLQSPVSQRTAILVRDKTHPPHTVAQTLETLQPWVQQAGAKLLVHTHVHLALAFNLAGVQVASGVPLDPIRTQLPPGMLLGASRHGDDPLDATDIGAADYATISPIFQPTSKPNDTRLQLGLAGLHHCVQRSARPLVALGGLQPNTVAAVMQQGARAIAVSGAILQAPDPAAILTSLGKAIDTGLLRCNS